MSNPAAPALESAPTDRFHFGQILVRKINGAFVLSHCGDETRKKLKTFQSAEDAIELSKFDDSGNYRPLKTAPNLARGWRLELARPEECSARSIIFIRAGSPFFSPGKLANCTRLRCAKHWIDNQDVPRRGKNFGRSNR